jgi:hypothetical protein
MTFKTEQLIRATKLQPICEAKGARIGSLTHDNLPVHGGKLLLTLAGTESDFGNLRLHVRPEPAYSPGGKYYNNSEALRSAYRKYGILAASSYGSFQIMYPTAVEMGFSGHPIDLQEDEICAHFAAELIINRFIRRQKAKTLRDVADAYNSGNHADKIVPQKYIAKAISFYESLPWTTE